jgi:type I restriction enzyme S subunit
MTREDWEVVKLTSVCNNIRNVFSKNDVETVFLWLEHIAQWDLSIIGYGTSSDLASGVIKFQKWDILFGKMRPYFRKVVRPKFDWSCSPEFFVIRSNWKIDQSYLFYQVANQKFVDNVTASTQWVDRPRAKREVVKELEISLPPLHEQQRIASILSAYDDLIENNTRRIALLEQMTQTLYRQWFVEYKFPWYQDVEMVESGTEFGMIPQGWEVKKVGEVVKPTQWMQVPVWEQFTIQEEWYLQFLRIVDYTQANTDIRYIKNPWTKCFVDIDEIAMIRYWEVWLVWRWRQGIIANNLFKINPLNTEIDIKPYIYNFFLQKEVKEWLVQKQNSSTLPSITFEMFNNIPLIVPSNDILKKFNILDSSYFNETINIQKKNQSLKEQRDLLLRKLIG